jgi:molybdate transport repressor ModE-like protein
MPTIVENDASASVLRELWDTTRMRLLVEIGRRGSVSAAAAAVGIGQPSASQHLRLLEAAAGQRLVERGGRGSRLTEAGEVLAARAAQALASLASAEEELAALSGLRTGTIHLGASSVPGIYLLPEALDCFRAEHPGVTVEVKIGSTADVLERLVRGDVQLALVGAPTADRVELRPFLDDELIGIARPGLLPLSDGVVAADALRDRLLLCREPGSASQAVVDEALARGGVVPAGRWELGASEAIKRAARQGLGVALLSRFAVAEEIARGELEAFAVAGVSPIRRSLSVATVAGRDPSPAEEAFVATLLQCCARTSAPIEPPRLQSRRLDRTED